MSRGRGQRSTAQTAIAPRPGTAGSGWPADSPFSQLSTELDVIDAGVPEDIESMRSFWRNNREPLGDLCIRYFVEALERNDFSAARVIGSEFHRRQGNLDVYALPLHATDEQLEAVRDLFRMLPYLSDDPLAILRDESAHSFEHDLINDWDRTAIPLLGDLCRDAREGRAEALYTWPQEDDPLESVHQRAEDALRVVRWSIADSDLKGPVQARVWVSEAAFCEMAERLARWSGAASAASARWAGSPVAVLAIDCLVSGQPLRLRVAHGVGSHREVNPREGVERRNPALQAHRLVEAFVQKHAPAISTIVSSAGVELSGPPVSEWKGYEKGRAGARTPVISERDLFGSRACDHPDGSWRRVGDEAALSCGRCGRAVIARVPLHQISRDHECWEGLDDASYLARRDYWCVVRGEAWEPRKSLGELVARDGLVSADPAHYATHDPEAARPVSSVAAAMRRR